MTSGFTERERLGEAPPAGKAAVENCAVFPAQSGSGTAWAAPGAAGRAGGRAGPSVPAGLNVGAADRVGAGHSSRSECRTGTARGALRAAVPGERRCSGAAPRRPLSPQQLEAAAQPMGAAPGGPARGSDSQWARPPAGSPRSPGQQRRRRCPIGAAQRRGRGLTGRGVAPPLAPGSRVSASWAARSPPGAPVPAGGRLTGRRRCKGRRGRVHEGLGVATTRGAEPCQP